MKIQKQMLPMMGGGAASSATPVVQQPIPASNRARQIISQRMNLTQPTGMTGNMLQRVGGQVAQQIRGQAQQPTAQISPIKAPSFTPDQLHALTSAMTQRGLK